MKKATKLVALLLTVIMLFNSLLSCSKQMLDENLESGNEFSDTSSENEYSDNNSLSSNDKNNSNDNNTTDTDNNKGDSDLAGFDEFLYKDLLMIRSRIVDGSFKFIL